MFFDLPESLFFDNIEVLIERRNVNNERLFDIFDDAVMGFFDQELNVWTDAEEREAVQDWFTGLIPHIVEQEEKIVSANIVCDSRVNTKQSLNNGDFKLVVSYNQQHCLNTTTITYTFRKKNDP